MSARGIFIKKYFIKQNKNCVIVKLFIKYFKSVLFFYFSLVTIYQVNKKKKGGFMFFYLFICINSIFHVKK